MPRSVLVALIRAEPSPADVPLVPGSWDVVPYTNKWCSVYPLGRGASPTVYAHARLMLRDATIPTRAVFVIIAQPAVLTYFANLIASDGLPWTRTWAGIAALRADAGVVATQVKAAWIDERTPPIVSAPGVFPVVYGAPTGERVRLRAAMAGFTSDEGEA